MGMACLRLTQSLADLQVELREAAAGLRQVPAGTHHRQAARLAQRLVAEVDVQKRLDRVVRLVAKDVVGPQRPEDEGGAEGSDLKLRVKFLSVLTVNQKCGDLLIVQLL